MDIPNDERSTASKSARRSPSSARKTSVFEELYCHLLAELNERCGGPREIKDQSDVYILELKILKRMTRVELMARIQSLRQNLRQMMVSQDYNDLMEKIASVTRDDTSIESLRSEARALTDRVYRRYVLVPKVEDIRLSIARHLLALSSVSILSLCLVMVNYLYAEVVLLQPIQIAYLSAAISGSLGATASTLIRLQKLDVRREPLMQWLSLKKGETSLWLSPVLGALFGLVLFLLFRSGVITGSMFPDVSKVVSQIAYPGLDDRSCTVMSSCADIHRAYTALLLWCFIAGWAERLVPDVLDRLANQAKSRPDKS